MLQDEIENMKDFGAHKELESQHTNELWAKTQKDAWDYQIMCKRRDDQIIKLEDKINHLTEDKEQIENKYQQVETFLQKHGLYIKEEDVTDTSCTSYSSFEERPSVEYVDDNIIRK